VCTHELLQSWRVAAEEEGPLEESTHPPIHGEEVFGRQQRRRKKKFIT
jgi:hypothetical protein